MQETVARSEGAWREERLGHAGEVPCLLSPERSGLGGDVARSRPGELLPPCALSPYDGDEGQKEVGWATLGCRWARLAQQAGLPASPRGFVFISFNSFFFVRERER